VIKTLIGKRIKILSEKIWKPRNYNRKVRKIFKQNEYKKGNKEKKKQNWSNRFVTHEVYKATAISFNFNL